MTDSAKGEMTMEEFEQLVYVGSSLRTYRERIMAHDAALRQRLAEMEGQIEEWRKRANDAIDNTYKVAMDLEAQRERAEAAETKLAALTLAMDCPLALSCLCCGQLMQPSDIAIRWGESMIVVCFKCRDEYGVRANWHEYSYKDIAAAIRALITQGE